MKKTIAVLSLTLILFSGCTDAKWAKVGGLGDQFKIELVNCDGTITHSWTSTGKVSTESQSDGYYFIDYQTGKLIEVSGTVIITKL